MLSGLAVLCAVLLAPPVARAQQNRPRNVEVYTDPAQGPTLESGLLSLVPAMTLRLQEGTHRLEETVLVRDVSEVTIQGEGRADRVFIRCRQGVGLAFFNASRLTIRDVTVSGCGLRRASWDPIFPVLNATLELTFDIPRELRVGVLVAACTDFTLEDSVVENTRGIGLLAVTPLGSTRLRGTRFHSNVPQSGQCPAALRALLAVLRNQTHLIGGGAYILYQDLREQQPPALGHELTIERSRFTENRDCSAIALVESFVRRSVELAELGYQVGAGGGLTVMMAQQRFAVATRISRTDFFDNQAIAGSGIHMGVFSGIPFLTEVIVTQCRFEKNGRSDKASAGGGIIFIIDLVDPARDGMRMTENLAGGVDIQVTDSVFERNNADHGGGVSIISHYPEQHTSSRSYTAHFHNCRFERNQGIGGSALLVYEEKFSGFEPGLQVAVSNSRFIRNSIQTNNDVEVGFINDYGVVHLRNVNISFSGMNTFDSNLATALGCVSSLVYMEGRTIFMRNKAVQGAGMQLLSESRLILLSGARVSFRGNRADMVGGAIYVGENSDNFTFVPEDCFLYFNQLGYGLCSDRSLCLPQNVTVSFKDNTALFGSIVFGSTLSTCPWVNSLSQYSPQYNDSQTVYSNLRQYQKTLDYSKPRRRGPPQFSTVSAKLTVSRNPDLNISVMPGEQFFINITTLDSFGQLIPEVVTASAILEDQEDNTTSAVIGDFGYFEVRPQRQSRAPIMVLSAEGNREVTVRLTTIDLESSAFLTVTLTSCSVGFSHVEFRCVCDSRLASRGVSCDVNFTVGPNMWLGPIHEGSNTTNDDLTVATCVLNYCGDGTREINTGEWHQQCRENFHRTGRLCGRCEDGYSLQLGTNACAHCTNWSLFLLIFFIFAGAFVVFGLGLLQISVAEGFFTATIFYSNIITLYAFYFNESEISGVNFLTAFFSLNFGIYTCLYDGLDSLALAALQLTFVAYLFLLALLHIVINKRLTFVDSLNQRYSPSKVFATLIILTYVSILQTSFGILSFTVVTSFDGDSHVVWFVDPTVDYFTGFHAFLCIVAIVLLLLCLLPAIFFTFCTRGIYHWPYLNRLKPLYDALFAPFKPQFRPWLGLQIIVRIALFVNTYFVPAPHHLLVVGVCLIVYLHLLTTLQPYTSRWANHFESTLIVNAILYVTLTLYIGNISSVSEDARILKVVFLSVAGSGVIIYGFFRYFVELYPKTWERVKGLVCCWRGKKTESSENGGTVLGRLSHNPPPRITFVDAVGNHMAGESSTLGRAVRSASVDYLNNLSERDKASKAEEFEISYTEYREPLLEEGDLEVVNSYSVVISQNSSAAGTPNRSRSASPQKQLRKAQTLEILEEPVELRTSQFTA